MHPCYQLPHFSLFPIPGERMVIFNHIKRSKFHVFYQFSLLFLQFPTFPLNITSRFPQASIIFTLLFCNFSILVNFKEILMNMLNPPFTVGFLPKKLLNMTKNSEELDTQSLWLIRDGPSESYQLFLAYLRFSSSWHGLGGFSLGTSISCWIYLRKNLK